MEDVQAMSNELEAFDRAHMEAIQMLLEPPSPHLMKGYYDQYTNEGANSCVKVQHIGTAMGKGVFATKDFDEGDVIVREPRLVGIQNTHSKDEALVCSFCFQYIGSLEFQIQRKLFALGKLGQISSAQPKHEDRSQDSHSRWFEDVTESTCEAPNSTSTCCTETANGNCESIHDGLKGQCKEGNSPSGDSLSFLMNDSFQLPFREIFPLPQIVECCGGCHEEVFCSEACAAAAWGAYHCLLCTGPKSLCPEKNFLSQFKQFADETNDIFHLAAQVIAFVLCKCRKLESMPNVGRPEEAPDVRNFKMLLEAWEPFAMGHKRLWWEAIALPEDVDPNEENIFRNQMKELAINSLGLLRKVLFVEKYAPLFSLKVFGNIVGMFELNNLEIVVASPVEDYFIFIDELPLHEKNEAERITRPILEALGEEYASHCQGTGFFVLQSCMNHSCRPNAKAFKQNEDKDGQAVVIATQKIQRGEEITISYIDEQLPLEERMAMLADYGFTCQCSKCVVDCEAMHK